MLYQIIRAPSPGKLLDEGRVALDTFKKEEAARKRRGSFPSGLLSSFLSIVDEVPPIGQQGDNAPLGERSTTRNGLAKEGNGGPTDSTGIEEQPLSDKEEKTAGCAVSIEV